MSAKLNHLLALLVAPCCLAGCGLAVPDIKEAWDQDIPAGALGPEQVQPWSGTAQIEFEIKKRIFCDLKDAVAAADTVSFEENGKSRPLLPNDWERR